MNWMFRPLRRYADFGGRAPRREFWLFHLFYWGGIIAIMIVAGTIDAARPDAAAAILWMMGVFVLAMFIPMLNVSVRRLHDHDKSGWFYLLALIPGVGWIFWLIMMLTPGTQGGNSYGDDPRNPATSQLSEVFG